jgi:ectoine hydroxylase-related dioxygenase (phytanoyl-CoA dioxygenase family)
MLTITPTPEEKAAGRLSEGHLAAAVAALEVDGLVLLENIVDLDHIAALRERVLADSELLLARKDRPFNWNTGNLQQDPPPFPPYLYRDVMVNDLVIDVTFAVLGSGMKNILYSGNTALPSKDRQPVHADLGHLWPNLKHIHPPYAIVANIPLVDVSPENGSTEVWPGTHLDPSITWQTGSIEVPEEDLARWRETSPPFQPTYKAGSVLIRDVRLWHAGMPNLTPNPRPMIAHMHAVSWWPSAPLKFQKGSESLLEHPRLATPAEFLDQVDHISAPGAYAYSEESV